MQGVIEKQQQEEEQDDTTTKRDAGVEAVSDSDVIGVEPGDGEGHETGEQSESVSDKGGRVGIRADAVDDRGGGRKHSDKGRDRKRGAVEGGGFKITDDLELGSGTIVQKYKDNVAAIKVLQVLEREQRKPTDKNHLNYSGPQK